MAERNLLQEVMALTTDEEKKALLLSLPEEERQELFVEFTNKLQEIWEILRPELEHLALEIFEAFEAFEAKSAAIE